MQLGAKNEIIYCMHAPLQEETRWRTHAFDIHRESTNTCEDYTAH